MTKTERTELMQWVRKREHVRKVMAEERAATVIAEGERQIAAIYYYDDDDDAVWKELVEAAKVAVTIAQEGIAKRAAELGIPRAFAPGFCAQWYERGENAVKQRRAELYRVLKSEADVQLKAAKVQIERESFELQTKVVTNGIESDAARAFLESMPSVEALIPEIDVKKLMGPKLPDTGSEEE
jgi:hypothetical protein